MAKYRLRPIGVEAEQNLTGQVRTVSGSLAAPPGHWVVQGMPGQDKPIILKEKTFHDLCMPADGGDQDLYRMLAALLAANTDEFYPSIPCCFRCSMDHKRGRSADNCKCPGRCHEIRDLLKSLPAEDVHAG